MNQIINTIQDMGMVPFSTFMQLALYHPVGGYYSSLKPKIGQEGDFITAPMLGPWFSNCIASQCKDVLNALNGGDILEFGAGTGQMCVDILKALEQLNTLPDRYLILDLSGGLKEIQQQTISQLGDLASRVHWINTLPEKPIKGVMLANEVLDAMPVERIVHHHDTFERSFIKVNQEGQLEELFLTIDDDSLYQKARSLFPGDQQPYVSEINTYIDGWIKSCYQHLTQGMVLLIDYGFPAHEYYHPDRQTGTLMAHFKHQAHQNILAHVGEQDITAHVDFTHVAEAAHNSGFHVAGFASQGGFLMALGLMDMIQHIPESERMSATEAIKTLVMPQEMGELFKVMALTRDMDLDLRGFMLQDRRAHL